MEVINYEFVPPLQINQFITNGSVSTDWLLQVMELMIDP